MSCYLFDYQVFANMAGFSALTGLMSGTELCSNREQSYQKPAQVFMCACQPAFFSPRPGGFVVKEGFCSWRASPNPLITAGCGVSHTTPHSPALQAVTDLLLPTLGLSFWRKTSFK